MRKRILLLIAALAAGRANLVAQEKPAEAPHDMEHMQHGAMKHGSRSGFMQHGMSHAVAQGVKLEEKMDEAAHVVTLREGPMNLPANTSHTKAAQPPDVTWTIPFDGWLLGYAPKMMDAAGGAVPGKLLHHTAFWNVDRSDFLCRNKEEHIFGAGSEMNLWPAIPGYGYRVQKGDQIRIETMVYNPTGTDYPRVWLEVEIPYLPAGGAARARSVYPAWIDVKECGNSGYDVPAGKSARTGTVTVPFTGALLGLGGHLHDYGRTLILTDPETKTQIAKLDAKVDEKGQLISMPIVTFYETGGYKLRRGARLQVAAAYDNPTGKVIPDGAMGIMVGYFVPDGEAGMAALRRMKKPIAKHIEQ